MSDASADSTTVATSAGSGHRSRRNTGAPSGSLAQRLGGQVDVHGAGQGVGDDQRR